MALATQCPHCHTTFRVAHDQLKLRAGLVRCGACKQIFNGIENLLRPEDMEQAGMAAPSPPPPVAETPAPLPEPSVRGPEPVAAADLIEEDSAPAAEAGSEEAVAPQPPEEPHGADADGDKQASDPLLRMTLMDFTHVQRVPDEDAAETPPAAADEADPLDRVIDDLQRKPWRAGDEAADSDADELDRADAADYEEPSFVRQGRRRHRIGRVLRIFMTAGSIVLLLALLAQSAYVFRNEIAAWFPQTKPMLAEACIQLGCQVGLPAQIEVVAIESSELQALTAGGNTFALTVLLRNHGATPQAWPHIELTLNDANEKALARRVFAPREYLPPDHDVMIGFTAKSEQSVKLFFELAELKASGYRVYLFYP